MRLRDREVGRILKAPLEGRHYRAVRKMLFTCGGPSRFADTLWRYMFATGAYPHDVRLRTPLGTVSPTLYSYHDMLTVNEIFFREDYQSADCGVVVDIGANIGLSALYFLTRGANCRCYLFEPVPANIRKLKINLSSFAERYVLREVSVGTQAGPCEFGIESTGRYGGIGRETGTRIIVDCLSINDVLREVLSVEKYIDVLKLDTEGTERELVEAIEPEHRRRIRRLIFENDQGRVVQCPLADAVPA